VDDQTRRQVPESFRNALERTEHIAETLVGQTESDARTAAEVAGIAVRIEGRNGESFPLTADLDMRRVNLTIEGETVAAATVG